MHWSLRMSKYKQKGAKNARKSGLTICIRTQPAVFTSLLALCDGADFMLGRGNQTDSTTHIHLHSGGAVLLEMGK